MVTELELKNIDLSRIKIYKTINNPNYASEYRKINRLSCIVCNVIISINSKHPHIKSSKHQLNMLRNNLTDSESCFVKTKLNL